LRDIEKSQAANQRFSYLDFYIRRSRRLFPALFVTAAITFCAGALLLVPAHLERFSGALLSSLLWFSNVFFWSESGYFDADANIKPLLHTWSLSVEEQFYLIWPAFMVGLATLGHRSWILLGIFLSSVVSLLGAQWMHLLDPAAAFFMMPFRIYEFGMGGLLVWLVKRKLTNPWVLEAILLFGLSAVGASFLLYREWTVVPGWMGLIPCFGAASIIYAGQAPRLGWLLSNPVSVYIGRISYSLYLVHWPIVVFYRYRREDFGVGDQTIVVLAALVAAIVLHHLVEEPLRNQKNKTGSYRPFIVVVVVAMLALAIPASHAWINKGWGWRWNVPQPILDVVGNFVEVRDATWQPLRDPQRGGTVPFSSHSNGVAPKRTNVLLVGDSHSKDVFNAFYLDEELQSRYEVRRLPLAVWCMWRLANAEPPEKMNSAFQQRCKDQTSLLLDDDMIMQADWIMLSLRWRVDSDEFIADAFANLKQQTDARFALFGRTAEFPDIPLLALDHGDIAGLGQLAASRRNASIDDLNGRLRDAALSEEIVYIDKVAWICNSTRELCNVTNDQNQLLLYDQSHWTLAGARYYGRRMSESGALSALDAQ